MNQNHIQLPAGWTVGKMEPLVAHMAALVVEGSFGEGIVTYCHLQE
jgi:hypothetical protein